MQGVINRLLASQSLQLANRIAPVVSATVLTAYVLFNGRQVKEAKEAPPKFQMSNLEKWRATTWI